MPPVTTVLIAANVAVYLLQMAAPGVVIPFALWPPGGFDSRFEPWQLLTYGFLHGSFVHLLFNMFALYMFGGEIERTIGAKRYLQ